MFHIYISFFVFNSIFYPFYSKRQQVYIDWHPTDDKLGSIWWQGTGDEKGGDVRRGKIFSGERLKTIENTIRAKYGEDQAAGHLNNLPTV